MTKPFINLELYFPQTSNWLSSKFATEICPLNRIGNEVPEKFLELLFDLYNNNELTPKISSITDTRFNLEINSVYNNI